MAFLDEEDALAPEEALAERPRRRERPPRPPRDAIRLRRLIAVVGGVLFLILLVFGAKGCLNARHHRALENYASEVKSIMDESSQTGSEFFGQLEAPGSDSTITFENDVKSYRGTAQQQLDRANRLNAPDELSDADKAVVLTLEMRRNALEVIGENISTALGSENHLAAQKKISDQMSVLYGSDQLYASIAVPELIQTLKDAGVGGEVAQSSFMPADAVSWLTPAKVTESLSQVNGAGEAGGSAEGLALVSASFGDTTLSSTGTTTSVPAGSELDVDVQNQSATDASTVTVSVTVNGGTPQTAQIPSIAAGSVETAKITLSPTPLAGQTATLEITISPVAGATTQTTNGATYTVTFT